MKNAYLILVAAGSGSRMGNDIPKQFLEINGKSILQYSLESFLKCFPEINVVIVVHTDWEKSTNQIFENHPHKKNIKTCIGGPTRFHSVKNGLALIKDNNALVAIHDAARPLLDSNTIKNTFESASQNGNGIPFVQVPDSLRELNNQKWIIKDRQQFRLIQTPQTFQYKQLMDSYNQEFKNEFTDDASVVENKGHQLFFVEGNRNNIKITYQEDLHFAKALLKNE